MSAGKLEPIPFLDLAAQHRALEEELVAAFRRAVQRAQFVGGEEVEGFEREFADFNDAPWCVGVNSGTDALRFAYLALGVRPGDEVVTVAHTFIATTESLTQAGAAIRFVDIDQRTMTMDPEAAAAAISPRTVGLVPVHLYGHPADLDPLLRLAERHDLWVVEDAAQAHGAKYRGRTVGSIGDLGAFSFYPGKNLGSLGEGGAVIGRNAEHRESIRRMREHGQSSKYVHESEGYNGRLHAIQASFLRIKLRKLAEWNAQRRRVAAWYRERLNGIPGVCLPVEEPQSEHVYHLFVVRVEQRDALQAALTAQGIQTGLHYPRPLHLQRPYEHLGLSRGSLPRTEQAAESGLSLPMFPHMREDQVNRVAKAITGFYGRS